MQATSAVLPSASTTERVERVRETWNRVSIPVTDGLVNLGRSVLVDLHHVRQQD
jgi:hypothetical protein